MAISVADPVTASRANDPMLYYKWLLSKECGQEGQTERWHLVPASGASTSSPRRIRRVADFDNDTAVLALNTVATTFVLVRAIRVQKRKRQED